MLLVDRIDRELREKSLDAAAFERFATTMLLRYFPGLIPIAGGTDFGRDADIPKQTGAVARVLVTTAIDVEANLRGGLASMKKRELERSQLLVVTSQPVHAQRRAGLERIATDRGARLLSVYDRAWVAAQLYWQPEWRRLLLGIKGDPSALVRRPLELSTGIGGDLGLRGRDAEIQWLNAHLGQDVVVVGVPGSGKTRLLAELGDDVLFMEEAPMDRLADDLREAKPVAVVVDRVGVLERQVRDLRRIRDDEPDLDFGIILTAWPDQLGHAAQVLPTSTGTLPLPLMERADIHSIVEEIGVSGYYIQREIMAQAGGRVGWAIALADVARAGRVTDLFAGEAAHQAAMQYLAGIGEAEEAQGILAALSLLDGVSDSDLGRLATTLGISQPRLTKSMDDSSRRGLVTKTSGGWRVGPEALRFALVARWFFGSPPREDYRRFLAEWPEYREAIVLTAIGAAEAGSQGARAMVDARIQELVDESEITGAELPTSLLTAYARLDPVAASWAVDQVSADVEQEAATSAPRTSRYSELLKIAVGRFQVPRGVHRVLDLAVGDERGIGQTLEHPLRIIDDVASRIIPDIGFRLGERVAVADAACTWIEASRAAPRWKVFGHVAAEVLSPDVEGHHQDLADHLKVVISRGIAPAAAMEQIVNRIWPAVLERLLIAPDETVATVLDSFSDWARAAWMPTGAFGAEVSEDRRQAAQATVERFLLDLEERCGSSPGLRLCFNDICRRAKVDRHLDVDRELEIFSLGGHMADRKETWEANERRIRELVQEWLTETPGSVMSRLAGYRTALLLTGHVGHWLSAALGELGQAANDPGPWCAAAVRHGLGGDAYGLMAAALKAES